MKKILSIFLSFIMLISIFINNIYAENDNYSVWNNLSQVMQGQSSDSYPGKYTTEVKESTVTITLEDDITADPYNEPLVCDNTDIQVVLDLNGHILNRNIIQKDGSIIRYTDEGNYIYGYGISVNSANLKIIDSSPTTPHEGFIGSDYLWHLGVGEGESKTIYGGVITGGCGDSYAGAIQVYEGTLTIDGGTICGNSSDSLNYYYLSGGALYIENGEITISNANICYNASYDETIDLMSNAYKINQKFSNDNSCDGVGICQYGGKLTLINTSVHHNISRGYGTSFGAGVLLSDGILNVSGGSFHDNAVIDPTLEDDVGFGGAFDLRYDDVIMSDCEISNNLASGSAGINIFYGSLELNNVVIKNNTSKQTDEDMEECYGAGIYACGVPTVVLNNVIITGNKACWGGGIFLDNYGDPTNLTINGGEISNNSAIDPYDDGQYGYGGAIYSNNSVVNLNDVKIIDNNAECEGGAIMMYSDGYGAITVGGNTVVSGNSCEGNGGLDESNISFRESDPYINISQTNPLTDDAKIGITVWYENPSYWNLDTNVLPFFNGINESNKDNFFLVNNGDPYNGIVFYITDLGPGSNMKQTNKVVIEDSENGKISIKDKYYIPGNTVEVIILPSDGYKLKSLIYDDGKDNDITSTKQFKMPAHDVIVKAVFEKVSSPSPKPSYVIPSTGIK